MKTGQRDVFDVMDALGRRTLELTAWDTETWDPVVGRYFWGSDTAISLMSITEKWQKEILERLPWYRLIEYGYERLFFFRDLPTNLKGIIAIHSTRAGPALGGCRMWDYENFDEALDDVLRLSRAMTHKGLLADTGTGGGKAVIWGNADDPTVKTTALLGAFGKALIELNTPRHIYITGEDVGITVQDIETIARVTAGRHVAGRSSTVYKNGFRGAGDPSPTTALGVIRGMKAALDFLEMGNYFYDKTIAIQGLGKVGMSLAQRLRERHPPVRIIASDLKADPEYPDSDDKAHVVATARKHGIQLIHSSKIHTVECDIFAPCALGFTLNARTIPQLQCKVVAGAQNNQLASEKDGELLWARKVIYVPDYVINAGGLIHVASEAYGYNEDTVRQKVWGIYDTVLEILERASAENLPPSEIADQLAAERLDALKIQGKDPIL